MAKKRKKRGKFTSVSIPVELFDKVKEHVEKTGFPSVSSYVGYLLREVLVEAHETGEMPFAREDAEKIRERLRALGYLG
ncbi:CopG family transcriptional regulator [candidate division MSBL1 archaeon SCGC-AAA261F17]|uniref:CopG family transcriptional regulator n=3 Tax=candidate division MSBL1 TaxID=215777 RepID=A0A133V7P0_9EURY|nr:CopG family transcriptional regulator [candidate division MSBL1 archaeon SCGC-AAA261F17]KXB04265.1 CopG family transcriptional regulator [candidate division MSBL1 archaeon SCGC-AAA261G05]KXB05122.1 CopG family transcriptional regulator [candidate division MSBL1 archaeon SCGC-AAA261O19]